jgi:inosine/xanthosine triphosphatase
MKIILTTKNAAKVSAAVDALDQIFGFGSYEIGSVDLESAGSEPFGEESLLRQIKIGIAKAEGLEMGGDYYVGMEGGVIEQNEYMEEVACVIVKESKSGQFGISKAASFQVPRSAAADVKRGMPFAEAVEKNFSVHNVKQGGGFVHILTKGIITKKDLYFQPLVVAMSKVTRKDLYEE